VILVAPARATSTPMARAAPPAPNITTFLPVGSVSSRSDSTNPLPSVFSPSAVESLEAHRLGSLDRVLQTVGRDLYGEVSPVQSVVAISRLDHGLSRVFRNGFSEGSRKFLLEVQWFAHVQMNVMFLNAKKTSQLGWRRNEKTKLVLHGLLGDLD
jgi:hypothetical protein